MVRYYGRRFLITPIESSNQNVRPRSSLNGANQKGKSYLSHAAPSKSEAFPQSVPNQLSTVINKQKNQDTKSVKNEVSFDPYRDARDEESG